MTDINKLRSWHTDADVACAVFSGLPAYAERSVYAENINPARDAIAMLVSYINLTLDAERFESAGEQASEHHQVAKEAAENALHYCEKLLRLVNGGSDEQAPI